MAWPRLAPLGLLVGMLGSAAAYPVDNTDAAPDGGGNGLQLAALEAAIRSGELQKVTTVLVAQGGPLLY